MRNWLSQSGVGGRGSGVHTPHSALRTPHSRERGWIFIGAYTVLATLITLQGVFLSRVMTDTWATVRAEGLRTTYYYTEALLELGFDWVRAQATATPPSLPQAGQDLLDPQQPAVVLPAALAALNAFAPVSLQATPCAAVGSVCPGVRDGFHLRAVGRGANGTVRTVESIIQLESFADFAYFINSEDDWRGTGDPRSHVWFQPGNELWGPVHLNGDVFIVGSPIFRDTLSTTKDLIMYYGPDPNNPAPGWRPWGGGCNPGPCWNSNTEADGITPKDTAYAQPLDENNVPLYQTGSILLQQPAVGYPDPATTMPRLLQAAGSGGLLFNGNTRITLDGTDLIVNNPPGAPPQTFARPANGVVCVENGNLTISGTLNGQLTACAAPDAAGTSGGNIRINNHLLYAVDPRQPKVQSDDLLGLIAARDVILTPAAPDDLVISGVVMALGDSIRTQDFTRWSGGQPVYDPVVGRDRGSVTFVGGVIVNNAAPLGAREDVVAPLGVFDALDPFHGYSGVYWYDARTRKIALPLFPMTGRFTEVRHWSDGMGM